MIKFQEKVFNNLVPILDDMAANDEAFKEIDLFNYHLKVIYLVPHSSHLTNPLDLVVFSI